MKRAKGGPEDRFKLDLFKSTMRKLFFSKQSAGVMVLASLGIFAKNRLYSAKQPLVLDETKGKNKVVVVGGGLSGLMTAYYLTEDSRNEVILMEKNRKVIQESSAHNGGVFQRYDSTPRSQKSLLKLMPGIWKMHGPQCVYLRRLLFEPGSLKFFLYYFQQGNVLENATLIDKLASLSESELTRMIEE